MKNINLVLIILNLIAFFLTIRDLQGKIMSIEILEGICMWVIFFFISMTLLIFSEEVRFFKPAKLAFSFYSKNKSIPLDEKLANKIISYFFSSIGLLISLFTCWVLYNL